MKLHIFNPEHDIALAANLENFTAPHAGRQLRHDLGFLPALWAEPGDVVLVDDVELAQKRLAQLRRKLPKKQTACLPNVNSLFTSAKQPVCTEQVASFVVWGWDLALRTQLIRLGIAEELLPTKAQIATVRQLSHRRVSADLLARLHEQMPAWTGVLVGQASECQSEDEVEKQLSQWPRLVLKAPWSSSGRGVRFVTSLPAHHGWLKNLLARQGSVMAEPYYNKVKDFGMEFCSDGEGGISYLGLSLFHTANGAYTGNVLATEQAKAEILGRYVPTSLLSELQSTICTQLGTVFNGKYKGPFGIDMMIVAQEGREGFLLHPCVEINLRRTMGHAALALTDLANPEKDDDLVRVMRIVYEENVYKLKIERL